ncbi:MAG: BBE domain-containing protein, partial [Chloroflexi bacterium]|nr:BBE domain-containing protein [Chloroflexota bacterium]
ADTERMLAWANGYWRAVRPFTNGVYVNALDDEGQDRVRSAYGANYERLAALKRKYDADNFFHVNHNIKPSG